MAEEVGIKISEFNSNISKLRSACSSIKSSIKISREFEKTNLKPFMDDLETTIDAIKLLERYKQMLDSDIDALDNVGKEMAENDEQLAKVSGPQMMRA
ncbi:TIGR04197 family type VII secretion effector [Virgibacillus dakarensis]|nr:TIGR04197 family type VII secretion effector [Lentibacillus populi]MBT2215299.1 TIGR04197 family type VII secretion effector [Virgibacillus dakarensis]